MILNNICHHACVDFIFHGRAWLPGGVRKAYFLALHELVSKTFTFFWGINCWSLMWWNNQKLLFLGLFLRSHWLTQSLGWCAGSVALAQGWKEAGTGIEVGIYWYYSNFHRLRSKGISTSHRKKSFPDTLPSPPPPAIGILFGLQWQVLAHVSIGSLAA